MVNLLLIFFVILGGVGFYIFSRLRKQVNLLNEEINGLKMANGAQVSESNICSDNIKTLIAIEITNVFELAKRESKVARYVENLAPELIRDKVYQQVVLNMKEELAREGVEHNINIVYQ